MGDETVRRQLAGGLLVGLLMLTGGVLWAGAVIATAINKDAPAAGPGSVTHWFAYGFWAFGLVVFGRTWGRRADPGAALDRDRT